MRSQRRLYNKSSSTNINKPTTVSTYSKIPRLSQNYQSIEHAEVEHVSKLRDYQLTTTDQNAQQQKRVLENEKLKPPL